MGQPLSASVAFHQPGRITQRYSPLLQLFFQCRVLAVENSISKPVTLPHHPSSPSLSMPGTASRYTELWAGRRKWEVLWGKKERGKKRKGKKRKGKRKWKDNGTHWLREHGNSCRATLFSYSHWAIEWRFDKAPFKHLVMLGYNHVPCNSSYTRIFWTRQLLLSWAQFL